MESDPPTVKLCRRCQTEKPISEFWWVAKQNRYYSYCKPCKREHNREWRERNRERYRAKRRELYRERLEDPVYRDQLREKWAELKRRERDTDPTFVQRRREYNERYWEKLKRDRERYHEHLEKQRIDAALRRERQTGEFYVRQVTPQVHIPDCDPRLPVGPIREWLRHHASKAGSLSALAARWHLDDSTLRKIRDDVGREFVKRSTVDLLLVREGGTLLHELYPGI